MARNIILIVLDDHRISDYQFMSNLQSEIIAKGITLSNFFATTPLCVPSRASILRGQYAHNTGVKTNDNEYSGGWTALSLIESATLPVWLSAAGYQTGLFGKYVNSFGVAGDGYVPPGWDKFYCTPSGAYYNYQLNDTGITSNRGSTPADYQPSLVCNAALDWIDDNLTSSPSTPLFVYLTPTAPHAKQDSTSPYYLSTYENRFTSEVVPRTPAFNETNVSDKPQRIRTLPALTSGDIANLDDFHRDRLRSLQPVDETISSLITLLTSHNQLTNTYIFVTSDNGFFLGEHRMQEGKSLAYDISARTGCFIRGPNIAQGSSSDALTANIDLAPTILDLANVANPITFDGRSLVNLIQGALTTPFPRKALLLSAWRSSGQTFPGEEDYQAFVTSDRKFIIWSRNNEREVYYNIADSHEIRNLAGSLNTNSFANFLNVLKICTGNRCRNLENGGPPTRNRLLVA